LVGSNKQLKLGTYDYYLDHFDKVLNCGCGYVAVLGIAENCDKCGCFCGHNCSRDAIAAKTPNTLVLQTTI